MHQSERILIIFTSCHTNLGKNENDSVGGDGSGYEVDDDFGGASLARGPRWASQQHKNTDLSDTR